MTVSGRRAGGIAVLSSYLKAASAGNEHGTFIVHAGDHVGGSPPNSALLQDEPAISFLNLLTNAQCKGNLVAAERCNVVGTLGNHEFDEGVTELKRLIGGGNHERGPFLEAPWGGARYPYTSSNVVLTESGRNLVAPYVIRKVQGIPLGFVGAMLKDAPKVISAAGVAGVRFLDEAESINEAVAALKRKGVHSIVVAIHEGATQTTYTGETDETQAAPAGAILDIIRRLDDEIDVLVTGHTHQFTNALVENANGVPMLVVQAFAFSTAYSDIDLVLDRRTGDVISKSAAVVNTWHDEGPGLTPDAAAAELVAQADELVAPLVSEVIGHTEAPLTRMQSAAGESALGNLVADSQRLALDADFAVTNPGGIRADLDAGDITWGEIFSVQPFSNIVVRVRLTGQQIYDLLNQQWGGSQPAGGRFLQISGFTYTWSSSIPEGEPRVLEVRRLDGSPISLSDTYSVAANAFVAGGGNDYTVMRLGTDQVGGATDLEILVDYVSSLPQPLVARIEGRIERL